MSRTSRGPWLTPPEDTFDGRAFYAAKTATDGQKRYAFGWNPTRTENIFNWNPPGYAGRDFNTWDWGGTLIVHEIVPVSYTHLDVYKRQVHDLRGRVLRTSLSEEQETALRTALEQ